MLLRFADIAAMVVVPVPAKGSSTVSPANENILIRRYANSTGNGGVLAGRGTCQPRPDRAKPICLFLLRKPGPRSLIIGGPSVSPVLTQHQYVLDVVLDNSVRLVRLSEETCAIAVCLELGIRDLVPDDRR